jgi:uncharacterized protein
MIAKDILTGFASYSVSPVLVEKQRNKIMQEFQDGKRESLVIMTHAIESLSIDEEQACHTTRGELRDIGIPEVGFDADRDDTLERFNGATSSRSSEEKSLDDSSSSIQCDDDLSQYEDNSGGTTAPRSLARRDTQTNTTIAVPMNCNQQDVQASLPNMGQTHSHTRTIGIDYNLDRDSASTARSARLSSSSHTTISSSSSLLAPLDRTRSAAPKLNIKFIDAAKKGDTALIFVWLKNHAKRSLLDQESINIALIELSKNVKHENRRLEAVSVLLDERTPELECRDTEYGRTPLIWAVCCGHEAIIKLLIDKGARLEASDGSCKRTPLLWAAKRGALKAAELLVENIQDRWLIDARDIDGNTALALAFTENHLRTAKLLLHHGADPNFNFESGLPLLVSAVKGGDEGFVRLLVENGANVQCLNLEGVPVLSVAVYDKPLAMIQLLIDKGADIQASDPQGRTPLIWAIKRLRENIVELLINKGASRNVADSDGRTAQYWAQRSRRKKIINLVCKMGDVEGT